MIRDKATLEEIRQSWIGVETLKNKVQRALLGPFAQGASFIIFIADSAHNLPLLHSYAVFNDVLQQLAKEGKFKCKSIFLGALLAASEKALSWKDFTLIKEGADRRNNMAHHGDVLPRGDCWKYIEGIREQLVAWAILDSK
ncbi:MAG: hypothetical protein JXA73_18345 [Acidobacteria bacterium]|nr:hypothetical protein [Acidobacteriota bacterium]